MTKIKKDLAPSLLSADFSQLGNAIRAIENGGAGIAHVDVMDGHFVPNLTIGPPVIRSLRKITRLILDVHLMIENPDHSVDDYIDAGADMISVHVETTRHLHRTISRISDAGIRAGAALNPATPISILDDVLPWVDFVLLMSVNPGFGGQKFIPASIQKVRRLAHEIEKRGLNVDIEVDGGVTLDNIAELSRAGVNIAVAGSAVFQSDNPIETIQKMLQCMI